MKYSDAQERLLETFKEFALAKQEFLMLGGELEFSVHRQELHMKVEDGPSISFPFIVDSTALERFKAANPQHEYKE
ncbi:predicted ORF [Xanthomonas phage XacN1]|nr:predicted ORF [Xanthomonas phage XacN1]